MMVTFADTSFYQALLNPKDKWHDNAIEVSQAFRGRVVTLEYVLCELGALMSHGRLRQVFVELLNELESAPHVKIISATHQYFRTGLALLEKGLTKNGR